MFFFAVTHLLKIFRRDDGLCRHFTATIYLVRNVLVLVHFQTKQSDRQDCPRIAIRKNTNCVLQPLYFAVFARAYQARTRTRSQPTTHPPLCLSLPLSLARMHIQCTQTFLSHGNGTLEGWAADGSFRRWTAEVSFSRFGTATSF